MKISERVRRMTLAFRLDEFADLHRVDEMHVEMHGRLRLLPVRIPAGHSHRAVREGHQHAALQHVAAVVVLGLVTKANSAPSPLLRIQNGPTSPMKPSSV